MKQAEKGASLLLTRTFSGQHQALHCSCLHETFISNPFVLGNYSEGFPMRQRFCIARARHCTLFRFFVVRVKRVVVKPQKKVLEEG